MFSHYIMFYRNAKNFHLCIFWLVFENDCAMFMYLFTKLISRNNVITKGPNLIPPSHFTVTFTDPPCHRHFLCKKVSFVTWPFFAISQQRYSKYCFLAFDFFCDLKRGYLPQRHLNVTFADLPKWWHHLWTLPNLYTPVGLYLPRSAFCRCLPRLISNC